MGAHDYPGDRNNQMMWCYWSRRTALLIRADESKSNNLTVSAVYFYLQIKQMETEQVINDFHGDIFFI